MVYTRLADDHRDELPAAVEVVVLLQNAQRVQLRLLVIDGLDLDAHAVLEVDDDDLVVLEDDGVGRAELVGHVDGLAKRQALLDQDRVLASVLADQLGVVRTMFDHLLGDRPVLAVDRDRHDADQGLGVLLGALLGQHPRA